MKNGMIISGATKSSYATPNLAVCRRRRRLGNNTAVFTPFFTAKTAQLSASV
jgi:hypothetical protein